MNEPWRARAGERRDLCQRTTIAWPIGTGEKEVKGVTAKRRGPTAAITKSHKAAAKKTAAERVKARRFCGDGGSPAASKAYHVNAAKNSVDARNVLAP